jgi:hypothetical protein
MAVHETDMLPDEEQLLRMSLKEIEHRLHGCSPNSDTWSIVWPVYETKRRRAETKRTIIYFSISTTIALVALVRSFFPASPKADRSPVVSFTTDERPTEPLPIKPAA